jgi:hypothetical protein
LPPTHRSSSCANTFRSRRRRLPPSTRRSRRPSIGRSNGRSGKIPRNAIPVVEIWRKPSRSRSRARAQPGKQQPGGALPSAPDHPSRRQRSGAQPKPREGPSNKTRERARPAARVAPSSRQRSRALRELRTRRRSGRRLITAPLLSSPRPRCPDAAGWGWPARPRLSPLARFCSSGDARRQRTLPLARRIFRLRPLSSPSSRRRFRRLILQPPPRW